MGEPRSDYLRFCHGNCGAAVMGRERLLELACPILWVWTVFSPRGSDSVHRHKNERKNRAPSVPREGGDVLFSSAPEASLAGASYGTALGGFPQETARRAFLAGGSLGLSRHRRYERIRQARKRAIPTRRRSPFRRFSSVDAPASRQRLSTRAVVADGRRPLRTKKGPGICPDPERPESLS